MKRAALSLIFALTVTACGPYRITYRMPSLQGRETYEKTEVHAHGIGPLLVGGGGFFFALSQMSPALINYTGVVDARTICPNGFVEVSQHHALWQQLVGALISWGGMLNWYHPSYVDWQCIGPPPSTGTNG